MLARLIGVVLAVALVACNGLGGDREVEQPEAPLEISFLRDLARFHDSTMQLVRPAQASDHEQLSETAADIRTWIAEELDYILDALGETQAGQFAGGSASRPDGAAGAEEIEQARDDPRQLAVLLARHLEAGTAITEPAAARVEEPEVASFAQRSTEEHRAFAERLRRLAD